MPTTDPRIDAAARELNNYLPNSYSSVRWATDMATAALAAADAVDPLRKPGHRAEISGDTWTLQHPPECRADMLACPLNEAMRSLDPTCLADGVWTVELDADKELNFTPVVTP
ncbi:hypothetical protein [Arthrobacter glacialis]|uniref:hypothetical protein n=1 Tax=Arthrobacter glacialis TaxID=1664 RepID=UPI000CD3B8F1|nr:hypothetical protein [Arthrobacter glacialis]POH58899.1 hypothetical protein CVS28_09325 [Arthrobacter glacialis]